MSYRESIRQITETLKTKYKPEKIILFGSCVAGKVTRNSDIDMLIVKATKRPYGQRWLEVGRIVRNIDRGLPFEPIIVTPDELRRELDGNLFLQEILRKGKVLYAKNQLH